MEQEKTALVLGITGGYGAAMSRELLARGYTLRALVRDRARGAAAVDRLGDPVELLVGDVCDPEAMRRAARGMAFIVHGVNAPYHRWDPFVLDAARIVAMVAAENRSTIVFPGNVYGYRPALGIDEQTAVQPPTALGVLRQSLEEILMAACGSGARLILLRGGDFFGEGSPSSWMPQLLSRALDGGPILYPTALSTRHQWAYLPDFARTHVALMARHRSLAPVTKLHFAGHTLSGAALVAGLRQVLGAPQRAVRGLPWGLLWVLGWFSPLMRALGTMRYLWDREVILREDQLRRTLGVVPATALVDALSVEVAALRRRAA